MWSQQQNGTQFERVLKKSATDVVFNGLKDKQKDAI